MFERMVEQGNVIHGKTRRTMELLGGLMGGLMEGECVGSDEAVLQRN